jgi:hypothetical protein
MTEYIIGVKRERREAAPDDWMEKIESHRGVTAKSVDLARMLVKSSTEIVEKLKVKFPYLHIEEVMPHYVSEETPS